MTGKTEPLFAGPDDGGKRLDRVLRRHFPRLALSGVYRLIRRGRVKVNRAPASPAYRLKPGDRIDVSADVAALARDTTMERTAPLTGDRRLPSLPVLYESEHVLAVNKPYGALVHGPDSLADIVAAEYAGEAPSLSFRPGPAHRLDRNTTGVQLFGLTLFGARALANSFHSHRVMKIYCALVDGEIRAEEEWEDVLERDDARRLTISARPDAARGLSATTRVVPLFPGKRFSLVFFLPETGRTHQLRFQSSRRGHPLAGDAKYGGSIDRSRYLLHCQGLAVRSDDLSLPPLFAPLDRFGRKTVEELFGRSAIGTLRRLCRERLTGA
ncbi:MAG: RluA family pseudouridine synthase [Spirochaetales bacterium]|nr:RluA family pseudouridine synthase [Spirochaetales bacterium]